MHTLYQDHFGFKQHHVHENDTIITGRIVIDKLRSEYAEARTALSVTQYEYQVDNIQCIDIEHALILNIQHDLVALSRSS